MPFVLDCGEYELEGAAEHPVVRRLRHRRLLAFLRHQGLEGTFGSMIHETDAFFSVAHLQDMMKQGQWRDAIAYLSRFLKLDDGRLLSVEAQVLHRFLVAHKNLADILAGTKEGHALAAYFSQYRNHDRNACHGDLRLQSILLAVLHAKQNLRVSWERVRHRAAEIAYDLVHRTPELKGVVLLLPGPMTPHSLVPIRTCTGKRYCRKKHPGRPRASALAKCYLLKSGSLLSSSHTKESANELYAKVANWVADILDESLKAGKPLELHQKHTEQTSGKQDATVASTSNTTFGSLAGPAKNLGLTSVETEGQAAHHVPAPGVLGDYARPL
ncbi:unnamed protein product [Urochloa decumbens]|uniref:Uncharacterized protein n=1 Tax=Urochloa decumbens TaxID=240449 RepID=A0ABC9AM91_9POAL